MRDPNKATPHRPRHDHTRKLNSDPATICNDPAEQSRQCLFCHENSECSTLNQDEHIIQAGLGGTLKSPDLICGSCNNYFSREIDANVVAFYEPISKILAPLLPGRSRTKKRKSRLVADQGGQCDIEYVGGIANPAKINKARSPNGQHMEIVAPASADPAVLERIAESEGYKVQSAEKRLITEHFRNVRENLCLCCDHTLVRGILLNILEMMAYASLKQNAPDLATRRLRDLRLWVRTGRLSMHFPPKNIVYSFARITDFLNPLFAPSTFSHRLVVCFDRHSTTLVLIAQFFGTMPWVFRFEDIAVHTSSVSILYKKALIDGDDQLWWEDKPVIDTNALRWRTFLTARREAREFAQVKFMQEFHIQHARAHYESDLRNDALIRDRLTNYAEKGKEGADASIDAIVQLIENRYADSDHLADIVTTARDRALARWTVQGDPESQRLTLYRDCLREIKSQYGYPTTVYTLRDLACR